MNWQAIRILAAASAPDTTRTYLIAIGRLKGGFCHRKIKLKNQYHFARFHRCARVRTSFINSYMAIGSCPISYILLHCYIN